MTKPERRKVGRYQVSSVVSVTMPEPVELHGQAINASKKGVLLEARGRLDVRLTIDGHEYRGWLARAYRVERSACTYAIELEDSLELADLP